MSTAGHDESAGPGDLRLRRPGERCAAFWAEVLGYSCSRRRRGSTPGTRPGRVGRAAEEHRNDASAVVDPDGVGPRLFFQQVPEGKAAKNRVHLDVRAAPGLAGRGADGGARGRGRRGWSRSAPPLRAARARAADERRAHRHADPEGNEFCLD